MKNSTTECVRMSFGEYVNLMEELNDIRMILLASERMEQFDPSKLIPQEEINSRFGITDDELADFGEVDIE